MNRCQFLFALSASLALLGVSPPGHAECGGVSPREFVETTYDKQARLQAERTPLGQEEFTALFSRGMRRLMQAPRNYPTMPMGSLLNAFFGYGVLPGAAIKVGKVTLESGDESGPATIRVEIEHRGEPHKILVRVVSEDEDWRIADISYDSGRSLAEHHRGVTGR